MKKQIDVSVIALAQSAVKVNTAEHGQKIATLCHYKARRDNEHGTDFGEVIANVMSLMLLVAEQQGVNISEVPNFTKMERVLENSVRWN